jgi:hypothetical protein
MGEVMNHLSDEQLVEYYFGEDANRIAETHLRVCGRCEQVYDEISHALAVRGPEPPAREPGYGQRVWEQIEGPLQAYPKRLRLGYFSWPRLVLAGACMLGLLAAFFIGAVWQRSRSHSLEAANSPQAKERVVLYILDDHLDRSERLLVELNHAGGEAGAADYTLQTEARQLLPDNRLYRQTLPSGSDPMMAAALDHLERVLLEVSNSPDRLNNADIARIEQEMNTDSLLFQIRVLRARTSQKEPKALPSRKGVSI